MQQFMPIVSNPAKALPDTLRRTAVLASQNARDLLEDEALGSEAYAAIDRMVEALIAKMTGGLSPAALALALADWSIHLAASPGSDLNCCKKRCAKAAALPPIAPRPS